MDIARRQSCFLIAPVGREFSPLLEALRSRSIEPFFISDFLASSHQSIGKVRAVFRSVDFVVALLMRGSNLENVFFELGIAIGLGKQTFVFAERDVRISESLRAIDVRYLDLLSLSDSEYLASVVSREIEAKPIPTSVEREPSLSLSHGSRRDSESAPERQALVTAIQSFRRELDSLSRPDASQKLELRIIDLFKSAGLTAAKGPEPSRRRSRTPDLALWLDEVQKDIGNPIAIEVKPQLHPNAVADAVSELAASLPSVGAQAGIVLHANKNLRIARAVQQTSPLIVVLSIDELLGLLEHNRLSRVLKESKRTLKLG